MNHLGIYHEKKIFLAEPGEIGNLLMQENLVMMYMHCTPADVKCRIAQLLTVACQLYKSAIFSIFT